MFEKIIKRVENAEKIGIFSHINPDGDAMGSSYSLKLALEKMGKKAEVFLLPNPDRGAEEIILGKESVNIKLEDCDLLISVDCADIKRLGEFEGYFKNHNNTIAIDHHITHHEFADETVVRDLSSCCELMMDLYAQMNVRLTKEIAHNLYIGIVSDTGNFKYSCATADTMRAAAVLKETGIDGAAISKRMFDTKSLEYYKLMRTALDNIKTYEDGKIAVLYLSEEDFNNANIDEGGAVGIVALPTSIEGVQAGVYIRERNKGEFKISLRSVDLIDVALIAEHLGGGGHIRASGYSVTGKSVEEIVQEVLAEIKKQL